MPAKDARAAAGGPKGAAGQAMTGAPASSSHGRCSLRPGPVSSSGHGTDSPAACPRFRARSVWNGRRGACPPVSAVRNWRADAAVHAGFIGPDSQRRYSVSPCPPISPFCPRIRRRCRDCALDRARSNGHPLQGARRRGQRPARAARLRSSTEMIPLSC